MTLSLSRHAFSNTKLAVPVYCPSRSPIFLVFTCVLNFALLCNHFDQKLDDESEPVHLHPVKKDQHDVEGKVERPIGIHPHTNHTSRIQNFCWKPIQTKENPKKKDKEYKEKYVYIYCVYL